MAKVTIVCTAQDRQRTVEALQELGTVHVVPVTTPESSDVERLTRELEQLRKARQLLAAREDPETPPPAPSVPPETLVADILDADATIKEMQDRRAHLRKQLEQLAPWGSFSTKQMEQLRSSGLYVTLCRAPKDGLPPLPEDAVVQTISEDGKQAYFAVVTPGKPPETLPTVHVPENADADAIQREMDECRKRIARCNRELDTLLGGRDALDAFQTSLTDDLSFANARDSMGEAGPLTYLTGFMPALKLDELRTKARNDGWAIRSEDVDVDNPAVPVKLKIPRIFAVAKPIFDFVGILPAYNESDVSISVLVFLTIFFGMIVGDAAYGALFLIVALILNKRNRSPKKVLPLRLFALMSIVTIVWGALNGTWFAIPAEHLPGPMRGISWLTDSSEKNRHIQWLCFLIGAIHLSLARLWRATIHIRTRQALGYVGWALLIWGNFFTAVELIVYKGSFPTFAYGLYGLGVVLVLSCGVNWRDVGGVMNLPFDVIGSFVDVLSYIRLFAVGLSSFYIADSFNMMGRMVLELSPWLFPGAVVVILFGHLLNVALAFMGVLVHGIRLNTLEFSNHMELSWSGRPYSPLKRRGANS